MIVFECPSCNAKLQLADEHAGKTIQCPSCKATTPAPADAGAITAAVPTGAAPATGVTTPDIAAKAESARRRDDDGDLPRRRDVPSEGKKVAGMGIGLVIALVVGLGGCCVIVPVLVALMIPA